MTTGFDWIRAHAQNLTDNGWTYDGALELRNRIGVNAGWPILAIHLLDEGHSWPAVCRQLGLNRTPAGDGSLRLADLDETDRETLLAEAREQVKKEYGLA